LFAATQDVPGGTFIGPKGFRQLRGFPGIVKSSQGDAIVFAHGNPTSSYLWRNVMPHLEGLGRLVACDLIGMGGSDKLHPSGPDRYHYAEQRDYPFALWDALDLGDNVTLVLHDWGPALGFDWASTTMRRLFSARLAAHQHRPCDRDGITNGSCRPSRSSPPGPG
jgi:haloalkane dehalogenase